MSAFVVSRKHIDVLVALASVGAADSDRAWSHPLSWARQVSPYDRAEAASDRLDCVGSMLWAENAASVAARYPDVLDGGCWPAENGFDPTDVLTYQYHTPNWRPLAVEGLKLIHCYVYQSCEHDGWEGSEAKRFCDALSDDLINDLPGYAAAAWNV